LFNSYFRFWKQSPQLRFVFAHFFLSADRCVNGFYPTLAKEPQHSWCFAVRVWPSPNFVVRCPKPVSLSDPVELTSKPPNHKAENGYRHEHRPQAEPEPVAGFEGGHFLIRRKISQSASAATMNMVRNAAPRILLGGTLFICGSRSGGGSDARKASTMTTRARNNIIRQKGGREGSRGSSSLIYPHHISRRVVVNAVGYTACIGGWLSL
jgi:hypothetical protein